MATITPRKNKNGEITSFTIRVYRGYDKSGNRLKPYTTTYKPEKGLTVKQMEKEANRRAIRFEEECEKGFALDHRQSFAEYADYVIDLKERSGAKATTIYGYKKLLPRINAVIGDLKLADIRPQHLNGLYAELGREGIRENGGRAAAKFGADGVPLIAAYLRAEGITHRELADRAGIAINTTDNALHGKKVMENKAVALSRALGVSVNRFFDITRDTTPLSGKTILEHHRFISAVLAQAEKEMLIPYNPAAKATPPKYEEKEANYFEIEELERIRDCLENEPIKWKTAVHLLLITGARRGEIMGLKWDAIDWKNSQIHIFRNLQYLSDVGTYEDTPKTMQSKRFIKLPAVTMTLLGEYRTWYREQDATWGTLWQGSGYLFTQENGAPMNPTSLTDYCNKFSERYGLPHINPHAFRHTMVSVLYFSGVDCISISRRLGHSKVSTTTDKYGHIMAKADEAAADCIADAVFGSAERDKEEKRRA
ncbi:MAG: tyrosine-type recombinase/integrase [Bacteroides sp.]|nr:tyrosine-type recombinase/integrase [Eubacterium sp.]MCM1419169.1 tyrosine-type recombinase/integrase [Roseburia sp.]MCM1463066.1 tyrosine-type recombinase/integrase [Bacteroides sp.]